MLDTALQLAADGHEIFPCSAEDKRPLPSGSWREHATTNPETIRLWWAEWPDALPAIALPANVLVVDIDPRNGGFETVKTLDLPDTHAVTTAGGGAHLYYSVPADRPVKNGPLEKSRGFEGRKGVDIKTAGGYVIAPGAVRADGKRYTLACDLPYADAPEWLLQAKARGSIDKVEPTPPMILRVSSDLPEAMTPGLVAMLAPRLAAKGQRHDVARAIGGALAAAGWGDDAISELVRSLPANEPAARARDALDAAARYRGGEPTPGWGALERAGYAPGVVSALRTMAGGGIFEELAASQEQRAGAELSARVGVPATSDAFGRIIRIDDVRAPIEPVNWLCEQLNIAPGPPTIFAGYGGLGKSMLVQLLVVCAATGRSMFASMPVRRSRVLHLDYEQGARLTRARYQRLAAALGCDRGDLEAALAVISPPVVNLQTPGIEDGLAVMCSDFDLCVIDSLRAATPGRDENSSEMREPLDMLFRVSERTGCTFVVIHHARKGERDGKSQGNQDMRGNSAINDSAQTVVMLEGAPMLDGKPAFAGFAVSHGKVRDGKKIDPFGVAISDTELAGEDVNFKGLALEVVNARERGIVARATIDDADDQAALMMIGRQPGGVFRGNQSDFAVALAPMPRDRARAAHSRLKVAGRITQGANANEWLVNQKANLLP